MNNIWEYDQMILKPVYVEIELGFELDIDNDSC